MISKKEGESMIKLLGVLLLFFACVGTGMSKVRQLSGRIEHNKSLLRIAEFLRGEILNSKSPLPDALKRLASRVDAPFSECMTRLAQRIEESSGESFDELLRQMLKELRKRTYLSEADCNRFLESAGNLGYLDVKMQAGLLEQYIREQNRELERLQKEYPEKTRLYRSLGILGGAFCVIFFI